MNRPAVAAGNWEWRMVPGKATPDLGDRLATADRNLRLELEKRAPAWRYLKAGPHPLGVRTTDGGTNFSSSFHPWRTKWRYACSTIGTTSNGLLCRRTGSCWARLHSSIGPAQTVRVSRSRAMEPAQGHMCSSEKLLLDPYGKAVDGAVQWDDSLFPCDRGTPRCTPRPRGRQCVHSFQSQL